MALMGIREYARHRGVHHRAVQVAIQHGRIKIRDGKIDSAQADRDWQVNTDPEMAAIAAERKPAAKAKTANAQDKAREIEVEAPQSQGGDRVPGGVSYAQSRAVREAYMARLARVEYEEKIGKLVSADKVRVDAFNLARKAREMLLGIPDRLAPILAGESDAFEVHRLLTEELRRVCNEISDAG